MMKEWSDDELLGWRSNRDGTAYVRKAPTKFTKTEAKHLAAAVAVLTMAFAVALSGGALGFLSLSGMAMASAVALSLVAVGVAFVTHEMAHKAVAQAYGCWAEFRCWTLGLVLAVVTCIFGAMFAAPGAVYITGALTREQNGKVSAAGPAVNMALGAGFLCVGLGTGGLVASAAMFISMINLVLAGFNLIPIYPLDGSKIVKWSIPIYALMWAVVIGLAVVWIAS